MQTIIPNILPVGWFEGGVTKMPNTGIPGTNQLGLCNAMPNYLLPMVFPVQAIAVKNINLTSPGLIDGQSLIDGGIYLLANQTDATQNLFYTYNLADTELQFNQTLNSCLQLNYIGLVRALTGAVNANQFWQTTTPNPSINAQLGTCTTEINWNNIAVQSVKTITENYTVQNTDNIIQVGANNLTITFPDATNGLILGKKFTVKNLNFTGTIINPAVGQTIADLTSFPLTNAQFSVDVYADGENLQLS